MIRSKQFKLYSPNTHDILKKKYNFDDPIPLNLDKTKFLKIEDMSREQKLIYYEDVFSELYKDFENRGVLSESTHFITDWYSKVTGLSYGSEIAMTLICRYIILFKTLSFSDVQHKTIFQTLLQKSALISTRLTDRGVVSKENILMNPDNMSSILEKTRQLVENFGNLSISIQGLVHLCKNVYSDSKVKEIGPLLTSMIPKTVTLIRDTHLSFLIFRENNKFFLIDIQGNEKLNQTDKSFYIEMDDASDLSCAIAILYLKSPYVSKENIAKYYVFDSFNNVNQ